MRAQGRTVDERIAQIASEHHGVVTRAQLQKARATRAEIESRLRNGSLIRVHRGVFRVGHVAPSIEATYLAAVLACGEGAQLSGRAAGYLWGILKGRAPIPEVTAPTERRIEGVRTRRSRRIDPRDRAVARGIPVTTVAATVVELARTLSLSALSRACHEAGVRHQLTPAQVNEVFGRQAIVPGAGKLREVLHGDVRVTVSELETRFLKVLRRASLPLPNTNRAVDGRRLDCRWPEYGLTVELDSYRFHNSRQSWERDRQREREARARGDEFRRYTYADVFEDPRFMLRELSTLLPRVVLPSARQTSRKQEWVSRRQSAS
jgi:hypothetical protein